VAERLRRTPPAYGFLIANSAVQPIVVRLATCSPAKRSAVQRVSAPEVVIAMKADAIVPDERIVGVVHRPFDGEVQQCV